MTEVANLFDVPRAQDEGDPAGYEVPYARIGPLEVVCFPFGPEGAHKVTNRGEETARVVMLSTKTEVSVAVYPDSGKMLANTGNPEDRLMARRESAVDYYDGEA